MLVFAYGVVAYALFLFTFLYTIGFVENMIVPKSIDSGIPGATWPAVIVNALLLSLFAVQHTIMARPGFKRWWTQYVPKAAERSTFVLATCACLLLLFRFWRPIDGALWQLEGTVARAILYAVSFAGLGLALYSTFCIDHFDLFGLRQAFSHLRGRAPQPSRFVTPRLYRLVRNPLMLGFAIAFWATPDMTYGHLLFAVMTTGYMIFGIQMEERDLSALLGEDYRSYRSSTPMLLPWPRKKHAMPTFRRVPDELDESSMIFRINV